MRSGQAALVLALAVLSAEARADGPAYELFALSRGSTRPVECGGASRAAAGRWERARFPGLGRYCDALAVGHSLLGASPEAAIAAARAADAALPGRAAPVVLEARALFRSGKTPEAWEQFQRAQGLDPQSLRAPEALGDAARCAFAAGSHEQASLLYRRLVPQLDLLAEEGDRIRILVEAGMLAMSFGPDHLAEAVGYLAEARRRPNLPGLADVVIAAFALAADRQGHGEEAALAASEASGPWQLEGRREKASRAVGPSLPILPAGELDAMIALLAERRDRELAVERWTSFLDGAAKGPEAYLAHGRARRDALQRRKGRLQ